MLRLRRTRTADAGAVADVYLAAFRSTYTFPLVHTEGEVRECIAHHVIGELETWVALDGGDIVGFVALSDAMVEQLYVAPGRTGEGTGSRLLTLAKRRRPGGLEAWTFLVNAGARRFYRRHAFVEVEWGDGSTNEERQPDGRLVWKPGA